MSAGHGHSRPNLRHPHELKKLLAEGGAPELMQRWRQLDDQSDMPDLAGYNVTGTTRYIDKDFFRALLDPAYAEEIGIGPIDTGLSPEDTLECLLEHEAVEKVLLDADNDIDGYKEAHELATCAEHEKVRSKGGSPLKYERGLKKAIAYCEAKDPTKVPPDFACAPLLDEPDKNDLRVLKVMRKMGITDAFKVSKGPIDYSKATGDDQCVACRHWQADRCRDLSPCAIVDGLVRRDRWCTRFEALNGRRDTADAPAHRTPRGARAAPPAGDRADGGPAPTPAPDQGPRPRPQGSE